jgi:hypothetical protein
MMAALFFFLFPSLVSEKKIIFISCPLTKLEVREPIECPSVAVTDRPSVLLQYTIFFLSFNELRIPFGKLARLRGQF